MKATYNHVLLKFNIQRCTDWQTFESEYLSKHPVCQCCKSIVGLKIHHIIPLQYCLSLERPDLELDERNLITLCSYSKGKLCYDHHLLLGHLNDYNSFNINVIKDAKFHYKGFTNEQIKSNRLWKNSIKKPFIMREKMTEQDKEKLIKLMNRMFPL